MGNAFPAPRFASEDVGNAGSLRENAASAGA